MAKKLKIALEINDSDLIKSVQTILKDVANLDVTRWQNNVGEKGEHATKLVPHVILIHDNPAIGDALERLRAIRHGFPAAVIFLLSDNSAPERIIDAMKAGAAEYFITPVKGKQLQNAIEEVRLKVAQEEHSSNGEIYSFISSKGGLGSTVISVNTAVAMAIAKVGHIALADLSCQSGDSSVLLDMVPETSLATLCNNIHRLDVSLLHGSLARHGSGIHLLAAPFKPEESEEIHSEHVEKVLGLMKSLFDKIIVDCSSMYVDDNTIKTFEMSKQIFVVTELSVPAIRNATRLTKLLSEVGIPLTKVDYIINRYHRGDSLTIDEAERSLEKKAFWMVPNDFKDIVSSINRGVPLVQYMPHAPFSTNIKAFVDKLQHPEKHASYRGVRGAFGQAI